MENHLVMSFEALSLGEPPGSNEVDERTNVMDITDLHHEVFGIASILKNKIKKLGIERKTSGKPMTKEQCDNISEHIEDINATWNEELKIALGKTNDEVSELRKTIRMVKKYNDHLKSKQGQTVDIMKELVTDISRLNYEYLQKIALFMIHVRDDEEREKAMRMINKMKEVPRDLYNEMVRRNEAFFKPRTDLD